MDDEKEFEEHGFRITDGSDEDMEPHEEDMPDMFGGGDDDGDDPEDRFH